MEDAGVLGGAVEEHLLLYLFRPVQAAPIDARPLERLGECAAMILSSSRLC
jgi:hypothetical protein